MHNIIWLASYPKSGNTWMRIFLANLLCPEQAPVDMNALPLNTTIASSRELFDGVAGFSSSDLSWEEIERFRPKVYEQISNEAKRVIFLKIHDAYTYNPCGEPLVSLNASLKALYILRNPLDIACSYAHHFCISLDKAIESMGRHEQLLGTYSDKLLSRQLTQRLLGWSGHVQSWTEQQDIPVHIMRYEDMLNKPLKAFKKACEFLSLEVSDEAIQSALWHSRFEKLQADEQGSRFVETLAQSKSFFRQGKQDSWKQTLSSEQVMRILSDHHEVMARVGYQHYLDDYY